MTDFSLTIFSLLIIFLIDKYKRQISKKIRLIDRPDKIRKLHKKPVPLLGGIMVFSSFILINLYLILFHKLINITLIIFTCCMFCLILGVADDIKKISYKYKFLILIIIFFLFVSLDSNLQINKIYFSTFNKKYYLNYLSIPFTILCLLLLTNAINLIDGMDGLCILVSTVFIIWLISTFQYTEPLYEVLVVCLVYILYLNLKNNIFLGDSGTLFLGSLIGLNVILNYNLQISKIDYPVEDIFIALMLPGLDMFRIFIMRIINKKNPFLPDRIHLHHLLINKGFNIANILFIYFLLILTPILINILTSIQSIYIIIFYFLFYIILVSKLKKFSKNY